MMNTQEFTTKVSVQSTVLKENISMGRFVLSPFIFFCSKIFFAQSRKIRLSKILIYIVKALLLSIAPPAVQIHCFYI